MSCALKENKDMLERLKIVSPMGTLLDSDRFQEFEESLMNSISESYGSQILGNPFFFITTKSGYKVKYSREFFEELDQMRNEDIFSLTEPGEELNTEAEPEVSNSEKRADYYDALRTHAQESYDKDFQEFYEKRGLHKLQDQQGITDEKVIDESGNALRQSIERMNEVFDAKVILDSSISTLGELLPATHSLSKRYGKPVVLINPNLAKSETVFHEFGHLFIDLLEGSRNPDVNKAMDSLEGTALYHDVMERYPELSGEMLRREVLAEAMGIEADKIFKEDIAMMSLFRKVLHNIFKAISGVFGISPSQVQLLTNKLMSKTALAETSVSAYNTAITQKQKVKVEGTKRNEVIALLDHFAAKNTVTEDTEGRHYNINGEIHRGLSSTGLIKETHGLSLIRNNSGHKGSFDLAFNDLYTKDNLLFRLKESEIPMSLHNAMNQVLSPFIKEGETWEAALYRSEFEKVAGPASTGGARLFDDWDEDEDEDGDMKDSPAASTAMDYFKKNIDEVMEIAKEYERKASFPALAGNIVHKSIETYGQTGKWTPDVEFEDNEFKNEIEKIITDGRAKGSKFYFELSVFSELNKVAMTIDMLEIKADGTFVDYDFKTMKSFKNKHTNMPLTNKEAFMNKGYVSQLLIHGKTLKEFGLVPAAVPYVLLGTKSSYDNNLDDNQRVGVSGLKKFEFNESGHGFKSSVEKNTFNNMLQRVNSVMRGVQHRIENMKSVQEEYADAVKKVAQDINIYKRIRNNYGSLNDSEIYRLEKQLKEIQEEKDVTEELKTRESVLKIIDALSEQMKVLEGDMTKYKNDTFAVEYLRSFEYVVQLSENLININNMLAADTKNVIGLKDVDKLQENIGKILSNIESSQSFFKSQAIEHASNSLAQSSYLFYGLYKEKFEIQERKNYESKIERDRKVADLLVEHKDEIQAEEAKYWRKQYTDGILDLRAFEYQLADPGMSKSQHVQVVKNLIDKAATNERLTIMEVMPQIVKFNKNSVANKTNGNTLDQWGFAIGKRTIMDINGNKVEETGDTVIPEYTSKYLKKMKAFYDQKEYYKSIIHQADSKDKPSKIELANKQKAIDGLKDLSKMWKDLKKSSKTESERKITKNPAFEKLSPEQQRDVRFIHEHLRKADAGLEGRNRLTRFFQSEDLDEANPSYGEFIYNLPKRRMSDYEAMAHSGKLTGRFKSSIDELFRPAADEADFGDLSTTVDDEGEASFNGSKSDIHGNELFDIPILYRNSLGSDRHLQSYDIPTLLAMNYETATTFKEYSTIEADLYMISSSLKDSTAIKKTDSMLSNKVLGAFGRPRVSDQNFVYKAVKNQIDNRIYKRRFGGVYTRKNYAVVKAFSQLKQITSVAVLTGNFMSGFTTGGQGSLLRFIEGASGEHFNTKHWALGTKKLYGDAGQYISDTQKFFPESKTGLLLKTYGLENHAKALTNMFIQSNSFFKNFSGDSLFAITSIAENMVTAQLMYSMMSNIKCLNAKGEFIDKDGNVVSKETAMSLDEGYEVVDGKLKLNDKVAYTSRDYINRFSENGEINPIMFTNTSNYVKSVYADLFGQYNQELKSVLETNMMGAMLLSMKKWLPRGVHRRFRGITGATTLKDKNLDYFQSSKDASKITDRFFSQDQQIFQEGYYTTGIKFGMVLLKNMKQAGGLLAAARQTKETMSDHELANLRRCTYDLMQITALFALTMMLKGLINSFGDDDDEYGHSKDLSYFSLYLTTRILNEATSFTPMDIASTAMSPAVSFSTVMKVQRLLSQLLTLSDDEDNDTGLSLFDEYKSGNKKGMNKAATMSEDLLIPGRVNMLRLFGLLGMDDDPTYTMEDSYKGFVSSNKK